MIHLPPRLSDDDVRLARCGGWLAVASLLGCMVLLGIGVAESTDTAAGRWLARHAVLTTGSAMVTPLLMGVVLLISFRLVDRDPRLGPAAWKRWKWALVLLNLFAGLAYMMGWLLDPPEERSTRTGAR